MLGAADSDIDDRAFEMNETAGYLCSPLSAQRSSFWVREADLAATRVTVVPEEAEILVKTNVDGGGGRLRMSFEITVAFKSSLSFERRSENI